MGTRTLTVLHDPDSPKEAHLNLEDGDTIAVGSTTWYKWLESHSSFHFDSGDTYFTAYKRMYERNKLKLYWYGSRKIGSRVHNFYLGKSEALTLEKMLEVAGKLAQPSTPEPRKPVDSSCTTECTTELESKLEICERKPEAQFTENAQLQQFKTLLNQLQQENEGLQSQLSSFQDMAKELDSLKFKVAVLQLEDARLREQVEELQTQQHQLVDPEAIALLQSAIRPRAKGGSYAANNATGLKKLVEQALSLLVSANSQ